MILVEFEKEQPPGTPSLKREKDWNHIINKPEPTSPSAYANHTLSKLVTKLGDNSDYSMICTIIKLGNVYDSGCFCRVFQKKNIQVDNFWIILLPFVKSEEFECNLGSTTISPKSKRTT